MDFFKKFLKTEPANKVDTLESGDKEAMSVEYTIDLLAYMCCRCTTSRYMKIGKWPLFAQEYAYYIPESDSDLGVAKELFARNGINTHRYYIETNHFPCGTYSLCAKYSEVEDERHLRDFMYSIQDKVKGCKRRWPKENQEDFNKVILQLKQNLKQK